MTPVRELSNLLETNEQLVISSDTHAELPRLFHLTFELWQQKFETFIRRMDALCSWKKRVNWLDNSETCRLLNVSAQTMQTYRDTWKLPYSQINGKIYYKASDVDVFIQNQVKNNSKK